MDHGRKRIIFHVDVNSAFLSWSAVKRLQEDPSSVDLRTIPAAVGGDVSTRHGVITAKSIPAGKKGVKTGEPVITALRKCPDLVLVPSDFSFYRDCSAAFLRLLKKHAPVVEQVSIDEAYADMTEKVRNASEAIAAAADLRREIREKLKFTVNVGISENKLLAKTASDFEKPDRTHTLWPEEVPEKLWPLPIGTLHGCGGAGSARLNSFGIFTIGDAAATPPEVLQSILGKKFGMYIWRSANGRSESPVDDTEEPAKSYSNELTTAEDIGEGNCESLLPPLLDRLSGKVSRRMQRDGAFAQTIGILVKTGEFQRHSRQITLNAPTNQKEIICSTADTLMRELLTGEDGLFSRGQVLRLVGVSASNLSDGAYQQMSLFDIPGSETEVTVSERTRRLDEMMQKVNARYGAGTVIRGKELPRTP